MIDTVVVVVPARDEQALIGACLDALAHATAHAAAHVPARRGRPVAVRTLVVLDRCQDDTAGIVRTHGVAALAGDFGCVGAGRAAGVTAVLPAIEAPPARVWIASTDADSRVPPDWITTMVAAADAGADVVVGTVAPDLARTSSLYRQWRRRYVLTDGHPHVHGANLGVRADVYLRLGGWPTLATGEDVRLVARAEAADGVRIVRTAAIPVLTSGRLVGRVRHGFAGYLRRLPGASRHDDAVITRHGHAVPPPAHAQPERRPRADRTSP